MLVSSSAMPSIRKGSVLMVLCIMALTFAPDVVFGARAQRKEDPWQRSMLLGSRLGAEWYKMGVLRRELASLGDVLTDLRSLEMFPEQLTKLSGRQLVAFDRKIQSIERRADKLSRQIEVFRNPLTDAMGMLREMAVGQPVRDMLGVLEEGNLERIRAMLDIKHRIDGLWGETGALSVDINSQMGFAPFETRQTEGLEKEFFDILRANLGLQSEQYHARVNSIKDSLIARSDEDQRKQGLAAEMHQMSRLLEQRNWDVARQRLLAMRKRYGYQEALAKIDSALVRVHFVLGDYGSSLEAADRINTDSVSDTTNVLYVIQSLYALREYERIWEWGKKTDFAALPDTYRNLLLWLAMESGLSLGAEADYSKLAGNVLKARPYYLHVMHALARAYMAQGEAETALSVLRTALRRLPRGEADRDARRRLMLTAAQVQYEMGKFEAALGLYRALLDQEGDFAEALYGIIWCHIGQGKFGKAETAMRKLINQNPQSPLAAEAILMIARRSLNKALYEWKKATYLWDEYARLGQLANKLEDILSRDSLDIAPKKYRTALKDIRAMLARIEEEHKAGPAEIESHYDRAHEICELVVRHYETGSFQDMSFTRPRENLLHTLDSLALAVSHEGETVVKERNQQSLAQRDIEKTKQAVVSAVLLGTEIQFNRQRWLTEYFDRHKAVLADEIRRVRERCRYPADSVAALRCAVEKDSLAAQMDSLVIFEETVRVRWLEKLTKECNTLLEMPLTPDDEIYVRYHLGELLYENEDEEFAAAHEEYEKRVAAYEQQTALFRDGKIDDMPEAPPVPVLSRERSMKQYLMAIRKYPDSKKLAPLHYSLALCFMDLRQSDSTVAHMSVVARNFPESRYAPQAWMYLGEHYFDAVKLDKAIEAYRAVMKYPESEWFDEALYKLAWTHYRESNPGKAVSSFLALVDMGASELAGKALLQDESLDYIAISFSESDVVGPKGLERAAKFVEKLGDVERAVQILRRLAGVYREQGRIEMAKTTYNTILRMYADSKTSPLVQSDLISVLDKGLNIEDACKLKMEFFNKFNHKSSWAEAQTDSAAIRSADSLAAQHLYDVSVTYHQLALQSNDRKQYRVATEHYLQFIRTYPRSPLANECHYNYAEIEFSLGHYQRAAEEYLTVSKRYPDSKYKETAAWNAIVASQNLLKQEERTR